MYLNDEQGLSELFKINGIDFRKTILYNEDNIECGTAFWLDIGHIEFDEIGMIVNIVNY